jgi:hypothetical protein
MPFRPVRPSWRLDKLARECDVGSALFCGENQQHLEKENSIAVFFGDCITNNHCLIHSVSTSAGG